MNKLLIVLFIMVTFLSSCQEPVDGIDGKDGANIVLNINDEPAGANCINGGLKIEAGNDINGNSILDPDEIQSTTYICDGINADQVLVVSIAEPAGVNCTEGGVKLLIGIDTDQNGTLETDEVQNVSYICDGQSTQLNEGKTYIVLSGKITDAEAAIQIADEIGVNTQFVWILNTTQLTTVDLTPITKLVQLRIENNDALEQVNLVNLETVYESFNISDNTLGAINLSSLNLVYAQYPRIERNLTLQSIDLNSLFLVEDLIFENNPDLTTLSLNNIESGSVTIRANAITSLDISGITDVPDLILSISDDNLSSVDVSNLTEIESLSFSSPLLTSIDFSSLTTANNTRIYLKVPVLTTVNFDNLVNIGVLSLDGSTYDNTGNRLDNTTLSSLNLTNLESGNLYISGFSGLSSLDLSNLNTSNKLTVSSLSSLTSLDLSMLTNTDILEISNNIELTNLLLDNLLLANYIIFNNLPKITSLNFSKLTKLYLANISNNDLLTDINLSAMTELISTPTNYGANGRIIISNNQILASLDLSSLVSGDNFNYLYIGLSNNDFPSSVVNSLLSTFASLTPTFSNTDISLEQQGSSPPTGQGITDKATLIGNGNGVYTD